MIVLVMITMNTRLRLWAAQVRKEVAEVWLLEAVA